MECRFSDNFFHTKSSFSCHTMSDTSYILTREDAQSTMEYLQREGKLIEHGPFDCLIPTVGVAREYKQCQPHKRNPEAQRSRGRPTKRWIPATNKRFLVHRISSLAATGVNPPADHDVSHLCHNSHCCNPEHLLIEPHFINMSRINCLGVLCFATNQCAHIGCQDLHMHSVTLCLHTPPCIVLTERF
jgi:hypothetical protein